MHSDFSAIFSFALLSQSHIDHRSQSTMASVLDSRVFRNLFGTEEMRRVFSDESYVRLMIDVEVALGIAESKAGVIPADAGDQLARELSQVQVE
jgi:3-carboxy-cis,cis-muconate cycloisomerase